MHDCPVPTWSWRRLAARVAASLVTMLALAGPVRTVAADLPIADAHIHYSKPDWAVLTPDQVLDIFGRAGIRRALVSSTPDDGTLKLYEKAPAVVVPFLRPYRTREDMETWTRNPEIAAYVEQRLGRGVYRGIGEFHLGAADADAPVVKRFAELAARDKLFLHAHVDDAAIERLATLYPNVRLLWAHAGMSAPPERVGQLLDRFPVLWVELALRSDVAPGGTLDPAWKAVLMRHATRFMVGTDTWTTSRWDQVIDGMRAIRGWLGQLPRDAAEKIAYGNAERLFPRP
jgi:predicted TIM-barrel fold metal-dependent hydrolase